MHTMEEQQKEKNTLIYVIDGRFQIVYANEELKRIYPKVEDGGFCYEIICGEQSQCKRCPLKEENQGTSVIFNKPQNEWASVTAVPIEMPGVGRCSVITSNCIDNSCEGTLDQPQDWLYNKRCFFAAVEEVMKASSGDSGWCMMSVDIENLKLFNELYGRKVGDSLISGVFSCLKQQQEKTFSVVGYFGNDDFAIMMPYDEKQIENLYSEISSLMETYSNKTGFLPVFGVYEITDRTEPAWTMYDRAELARTTVKGNYNMRIRKFDAEILEQLQSQHVLYADIRKALKEKEFTFFLQPKCNMENGKIIGAEALVRWNSKEKGMISPGVFIPFLEKTGFIAELDLYIWEEVCRWQRSMLDRGLSAVPVSVNVSRVDIYATEVTECFRGLIEKYDLTPELIEVEITESVYTEDNAYINETIANLRKAGFRVLMDDFGSGYSSLNMLKDVEIDVLKMDMRFLDINQSNVNKGISIMEAIFNMAGIMGIGVIAEGVETEEQKKFLLKMGGGYGQGYYFYRPLPIQEFEKVVKVEENLDHEGFRNKKNEQFCLKNLLSEDMFSEVMINNMLGAVAFYDVYKDQVTISGYNEHYAAMFSDIIFRSGMEIDLGKYFFEEDYKKIFRMFECAREDRHNGAECDVYRHRLDDVEMWLHLKSFFLKEQDGHVIYYSSVRDITDTYNNNKMLVQQQAELQFLHNDMPCGIFQYEADGEQKFIYVSNSMLEMLGYSRKEFREKFNNSFINLVYKEDRERVLEEIDRQIEHNNYDSCVYRIEMADKTLKWVYDHGRLTVDASGKRWFYVVITDYDYLKQKYQHQEWQQQKYKTLAEIPGTVVYDYEPYVDRLTLEVSQEDGTVKTIITEKFTQEIEHHDWLSTEGVAEQREAILHALDSPGNGFTDFRGRLQDGEGYRHYRSYFRSLADEDGKVYRLVGRAELVEEDG